MIVAELSPTQSLILRILSEHKGGTYTTNLVKLIYLIDNVYFAHQGRTATGLSYIWDEYGPNASGHVIVKEAGALEERGIIRISLAPGGDNARTHHINAGSLEVTLDPLLETITSDVLRKYGSLSRKELVDESKRTKPFETARPGKRLVMERSQRETPIITREDWERHVAERARNDTMSIAEVKAKYGAD